MGVVGRKHVELGDIGCTGNSVERDTDLDMHGCRLSCSQGHTRRGWLSRFPRSCLPRSRLPRSRLTHSCLTRSRLTRSRLTRSCLTRSRFADSNFRHNDNLRGRR
ncbi:MAG: pentapeptide repeat-containing protein [Caldilinea sp.]